jgi:hypothetical protein
VHVSLPRPNQSSGPLADHVRQGRVYRSPLAATGALHIGDWVRDDLPDLLWPVLTLEVLGTSSFRAFVRWQNAVLQELSAGTASPKDIADGLDGRLTSLDRLCERLPSARRAVKVHAKAAGLLPDGVEAALASYPLRPAEWLVERPMTPPGQEEIELLARSVLAVITDRHREAVIKCLPVWAAVQAGTLRTSPETVRLLQHYPDDPSTRVAADSAVRAMWGAQKGLLPRENDEAFGPSIRWAKVFWGANSMTTRCLRRSDSPEDEPDPPEEGQAEPALSRRDGEPEGVGLPGFEGDHLERLAKDLYASFIEALETSPARLHEKERQEVHAGLVGRVARAVIVALAAPPLWNLENGAHIVRTLVEVRIQIAWMALQDPSIYRTFQDYGAGKAKLYARILDELPVEARRTDFEAAVAELNALSHNDELLDHRVVDTRDSFASGKSLREMAIECGLLDLYRQTYSLASGVAHSEWWSVETHVMERCVNVLHGGHLVPSLSLGSAPNVHLATSWVDQLYSLMRHSLQLLGTDTGAVANAFAWLEREQPEEQPSDGDTAD